VHDDGDEARISPRRSEGVFVLRGGKSGGYDLSYAVGERGPIGYPVHSWNGVLKPPLYVWLRDVKADQETPDRFAELQQEREMVIAATAEDVENTTFTTDEQETLAAQLREIAEYARKTYALSQDQMQALEAGLEDIGDKVGRLGRREWLTYVAGTLAILEATILPPEATRHIFLILVRSLAQLRGHTFPELPGGL